MNKEEMESFRKLIVNKKIEIFAQLGYLRTINDNLAKTSSNPLHVEDEVSDTIEREIAYNLAHREKNTLQLLNQALERINNGTYGICLTCGAEINKPRLEALPTAAQCVICQNKEEKRRRGL
jgi:DnaK suppressor protein